MIHNSIRADLPTNSVKSKRVSNKLQLADILTKSEKNISNTADLPTKSAKFMRISNQVQVADILTKSGNNISNTADLPTKSGNNTGNTADLPTKPNQDEEVKGEEKTADLLTKLEIEEDNLENEETAERLFQIAEFYPAESIVEACLYSLIFQNNQDFKGPFHKGEILRLWDKLLREIITFKDYLKLSIQEVEDINSKLNNNKTIENLYLGGVESEDIKLDYKLPQKIEIFIPEMLARILRQNILIISEYGVEVATGLGRNISKENTLSIYHTMGKEKLYENFGLKFNFNVKDFPRQLKKEMIKKDNWINVWDSKKLRIFIDHALNLHPSFNNPEASKYME